MNIYFLGDIGLYNTNLVNLLYEIKKTIKNEDIIILLGDNFYFKGINSVDDGLWNKYKDTFNLSNKIYSILGNHDYQLNPYAQIEYSSYNWNMPDWYYTLKLKTCQIWLLDTCQLVELGNINECTKHGHVTVKNIEDIHQNTFEEIRNEQINWLEKTLDESTNKTKIVCGHYPLKNYGQHQEKNIEELYSILFPILKKHKVDYYICGHEHNLQYFILSDGDYKLNHVIIGNSCQNTKDFKSPYLFYNKKCCFGKFDTNKNKLILEKSNL